jgi:hypothetical protein
MLYVSQIGDTQNPPPYTFPDVDINSFRLEVDLDVLTALCDELLNIGDADDRGFEYRPVFPFVDLEVLNYPKMEYGLFPPSGFVSQHECYVRFFVMKYIGWNGWLWPDGEMAVFCPMLIVDNPWSAFAGRDVMGLPKLLGDFAPFSAASPFTTIKTEVFRDLFVGQKSTVEPVVTIAKAPTGAKAIKPRDAGKWPWGDIEDDAIGAAERVLGKSLVFAPTIFECVAMKQFRDAMNPFNACYQAILQSLTFVETVADLEELPPVRITLNDYASFDLAKRLGLPSGKPLTPISQFHVRCSFSFGEVITLFVNDSRPFWWRWL